MDHMNLPTARGGRSIITPKLNLRPSVERLEEREVPAFLVTAAPATPSGVVGGVNAAVDILGTSDDGRFMLFQTTATNVIPNQISPGNETNLFWFDRSTQSTRLITAATGSTVRSIGAEASVPGGVTNAQISGDGRSVVFLSSANASLYDSSVALSADAGNDDAFVWKAATGKVTLATRTFNSLTVGSFGSVTNPAISSDGSIVSFVSSANVDNILSMPTIPDSAFQVGAKNLVINKETIELEQTNGTTKTTDIAILTPDVPFRTLSLNGPNIYRVVVGQVPNPVSYTIRNVTFDITFTDAGGKANQNLTVTQPRYFMDGDVRVDSGGRYVNSGATGYVGIRGAGDLKRYTYNNLAPGVLPDPTVTTPIIAPEVAAYSTAGGVNNPAFRGLGLTGNAIIAGTSGEIYFTYKSLSAAGNLVSGYVNNNGGDFDLYRSRIVATATDGSAISAVTLMSAQAGSSVAGANGLIDLDPRSFQVTPDGKRLLFTSTATNLVTGVSDTNGTLDVFQRNVSTGTTVAISQKVLRRGEAPATGNGGSYYPRQTSDGLAVSFVSNATNLTTVEDATNNNGLSDVFVRDLNQSTTLMASTTPFSAAPGNGASYGAFVVRPTTVDSNFFKSFEVFFTSTSNNLDSTAIITGNIPLVFRSDFTTGVSSLSRVVAVSGGLQGRAGLASVDTNGQITILWSIVPFPGFTGELRVAAGDVTGDGVPDLIVGAGPGGGPRVAEFDGASKGQKVIDDFFIFEQTFTGGVYVAAADFQGIGHAQVVVGAGEGGAPRYQVYDPLTLLPIADNFAYESSSRTGVRVSAADYNGDGVPDLGVAAGNGGGPRVRVVNGANLGSQQIISDFFAFDSSLRGGVYLNLTDYDGDGLSDLIVGAGPGGGPRIRVFNAANNELRDPNKPITFADYFASNPNDPQDGVRAVGIKVSGGAAAGIITGAGAGSPVLRVFTGVSAGTTATSPFLLTESILFDSPLGITGAWVG